ncbi:hypothetical protein CDV31_009043 [Fusarium ambrosium]|uniref:Xylanolytic transcriptional activator regulatory domain-containing protein n=1 Tax=Fusarium ambrosium TaxID=131363 RepID=A0A428TX56_9HYPO|nr:hypothetical protein CDV31_009043 [Fusarium ambrosium]
MALAAADSVVNMSPRLPGQEPVFSKIFLTDIMRNLTKPQLLRSQPFGQHSEEDEAPFSNIMGSLEEAEPITLPSREVAHNLVKVYFSFTNLGMPLLHQDMFQEKLDFLYSLPHKINLASTHTTEESRIATFFVLEVFAIALLVVQQRDASGRWLADRYHRTAVGALHEAGLPSDLEGVQALLLIGQHAYHHPTLWDVWKIVGAALRLAVELGLHQDPPPDTLSFLQLDTMRRTFWVAYAMDRNISTSLYLPSCLSDGAITAKFPSDARDEYITSDEPGPFSEDQISGSKRITLHLFRYRQIQSEIRRALHQTPFLPTDPLNLNSWQQQMHAKIETWYQTAPQGPDFTNMEKEVVETFEVTYNTALFHLYRPSLNIPVPSGPQLLIMTQAATKMIHLYRRFFRQHKLTIYWQAVENVSSAGLALLLGFIQSPEVRETTTLYTLNSMVHLCSSVLWGMVEHFPSLRGKRDAFDAASTTVLADLNEGRAMSDQHINLLEQNESRRIGHSFSHPISITEQNELQGEQGVGPDVLAMASAPAGSMHAGQRAPAGLTMGADVRSDLNMSNNSFSLSDSDVLTWMLEPVEDVPGTLPMTWM